MAVGLKAPGPLLPVPGVRLGAGAGGLKKGGAEDVALLALEPGTTVSAVFTRNAFCAAPVTVAREHLDGRAPRALVINAGNANAGTGRRGLEDARTSCERVAGRLGVAAAEVLPFSTGVIGQRLPMDRLDAGIEAAAQAMGEDGWLDAARAIMTTDTLPKGASRRVEIDGRTVTVTGIAKGSGMIRPDMATMLGFVATDAPVAPALLDALLRRTTDRSFNSITVDGDTSTNDACVLAATGRAGGEPITADTPAAEALEAVIAEVMTELAQAIIRDGEGATKFVTLDVQDGRDEAECRQVAFTVAHSPLVKTALFASDPNWGRILAAVGRAGLDGLDVAGVDIRLDEVTIVAGGEPAADYTEARGQAVMDREAITIGIRLGRGDAAATVWTTDLSYDYVTINAEYRT